MNKILKVALTMVLSTAMLAGCTGKKAEEIKQKPVTEDKKVETKNVKMYVPDGITALCAAKLIKENPSIDKNVNVTYEIAKTTDVLTSKVMSGEADIAIVPSNLAAQAYNKSLSYKLAGTTGWGSLFVASSEDIKDWSSLKGKEIYNIGKGLTPDIVFRYLLSKNSLNPEQDIKLNYLNAATELAPAFISGKSTIAVMPEPVLTTVLDKKNTAKVVLDLNSEWKKATGTSLGYPQASLIVKDELIKNNKSFVQGFLKEMDNSIQWANSSANVEKLGAYSEELQISVSKDSIAKCITRANLKFVNINDSKDEYNKYFKVLLDFEPKSIGGKLPDEGLYMEK